MSDFNTSDTRILENKKPKTAIENGENDSMFSNLHAFTPQVMVS
jgi:hypothetical protein